jgi:hypothetical protein
MKKGAVPVPYIIALLLGIAVIAILGYWFFVLSGQWGGEVNLETCRGKAHTYSTTDIHDIDDSSTPEDESQNVIETRPSVGWFVDKNPACKTYAGDLGFSGKDDVDEDVDACMSLLGG